MDKSSSMNTEEMVRALYKWAFGNGRKGVEQRLSHLEELQVVNAVQQDIHDLESKMSSDMDAMHNHLNRRFDQIDRKMDKIPTQLNLHEMIKLGVIVAGIVIAVLTASGA